MKFEKKTGEQILEQRREKFLNIGKQRSFRVFSGEKNWIVKHNFFKTVLGVFFKFKKEIGILIFLIVITMLFLF